MNFLAADNADESGINSEASSRPEPQFRRRVGSPRSFVFTVDPSLRLNYGSAQDDSASGGERVL